MKWLKRAVRDEKGVSLIVVAIAIVVVFGFAILAIDLSMMQLAKTQLQNAADAAALAGAVILFTSNGDQTAATDEAIRVAGLNKAVQDHAQRPVNIGPGDVTFPGGDSVTVITHRTEATGDAVKLFFANILGLGRESDMRAKATAAVSLICGTDCLRPFCPPDRWDDVDSNEIWTPDDVYIDLNENGFWDPGEPLTEDYNENGVWDPAEDYNPYTTGYKAPDDVGTQITLKLNNSKQSPRSCFYYSVRYGPVGTDTIYTGADKYNEFICTVCEPFIVNIGDQLQMEPGKMVGPTDDGLQCLIELDPTAEWDPVTGTVINSAYPTSPRIIKAPAFDPTLEVQDCHGVDCVTVTKIMVIFVEQSLHAGEIVGRFMKTITEGVPDPDCPGGFMSTVLLVE
ncbi:MAG: pilus assembly protein TadG-related protein [Candidatus Zixiibacteriota bacterium]